MSLNNIKIPPQLIAGLYPNTLVETEITSMEEYSEVEQPEIVPIEVAQAKSELPVVEESMPAPSTIEQRATEPPIIEQPSFVQPVMETPAQPEQLQFHFQGNNRKQILVLGGNEKAQYLPDPELKFFVSVLKACGLTTEDVAILNLKNQPAAYTDLQSFFKNKTTLLFGLEPKDIGLPMNFPQFQLQNFDRCTYLHAPALQEIEKDKALKMKLWSSLKTLFSL